MRPWRIAFICLAALCWAQAALAAFAIFQTFSGSSSASCPQGTSYADGCPTAPAGVSAQFPNYLNLHQVVNIGVVGGSGYTNGTGYAWTSSGGGCSVNASGTIDVSGGLLANGVISNPGSGCTGVPTIAIPAGAGSGTGGSITASSYQARPPWNVAGIDYGVGPPSSTVFKVAGVDTAPACVSQDNVSHIFNINANNCTIDSWDFTGNGGWMVSSCNFSNVTVTNSKFRVGANAQPMLKIQGFANSCTGTNATVEYNLFDGASATNLGGFSVALNISGNVIAEYNEISNSDTDHIDFNSDPTIGQNLTIKYNLLVNDAQVGTTHPDFIQMDTDGAYSPLYPSIHVDFNTIIQTNFPAFASNVGTDGLTLQDNCQPTLPVVNTGTSSNNTMIATIYYSTASNVGEGITVSSVQATVGWTVSNNYFNPTGISNGSGSGGGATRAVVNSTVSCGTQSGTFTASGNIDMITGGAQP